MLAALTKAAALWPDWGVALKLAFGYTCINLFFFGLVGLLILHNGHRALAPLRWPWLCYLGTISYGLYLYHVPVWHSLEHVAKLWGVESLLVQRIAATILTFLLATLAWEFLENPINSMKDRFSYKRTAPAAAGAEPLEVRGQAVTSS